MSGDERKKINLKMNINKYNIRYYVSESKLEKILEKINKEDKNLNMNELKLNYNYKVKRPNSSPEKKISRNINISPNNSSIKRGLTIETEKSMKILFKKLTHSNNNVYNNEDNEFNFDYLSSNSPRRRIPIIKNRRNRKKFSMESDIDIKKINTFRKSLRNSNQELSKSILKFPHSIFHRNRNLPLSISYKNNTENLISIRRKSLPINQIRQIKTKSDSFDSNQLNSFSKVFNIINTDKNEINKIKKRRASNPLREHLNYFMKKILSSPPQITRQKTIFKRKLNGKRLETFYDKLRDYKKNDSSKSKFTFIINKNENSINNNIDKINESYFENNPIQKKFIKKQYCKIHSDIVRIEKNKNYLYSNCLTRKINSFYDFIAENEKILLKKELKKNFVGKDETLRKMLLSFFNKISKEYLVRFLLITYKLYYKKQKRLIRSFYSISFPFLLDKYLNPRKGMLTLIFIFGIDRKTNLGKKPIRKPSPKLNLLNQTNYVLSKSSEKENKISRIKENINEVKVNKIKKVNRSVLIKKRDFFPEKKTIIEKKRIIKITQLLENANLKDNNLLYINDFISSDTSSKISRPTLYKNGYQKKKKFVNLFSKSIMKSSEKFSFLRKYRKSIKTKGNDNEDEIKKLLSSQKILNDNYMEKYANRRKLYRKKKTFTKRIKVLHNLFSTTNQEITKLKTQMIKASILKGIENNLYKVIFFHIKEDNMMLVKKYINDNYGFMNMNFKDENGFTFINTAVKFNCRKQIIEFLLIKGCNPNIPNVRFLFYLIN